MRYASGAQVTDYTYTGQFSNVDDFGLIFYGARWYDPNIMRWTSPDSIVPLANQGVQAFDRYAYVNNSPINFTDPSGYKMASDSDGNGCSGEDSPNCIMDMYSRYGDYEGMDDSLRSFIRRNPDYDPATDNNLNDFGRVIVSNAKFQVVVSNSHGNGTISLGLGGAIFALVGVTGSAGVAVDGNGNWGFILSFGGGGYDGIGISKIGPYFSTTNAPSLNDLNGFSVQLGGQVGDVASVGGEWVFFGGDKHYQGKTIASGAALNLPIPFEIHATLVYSWVFPLNGWK